MAVDMFITFDEGSKIKGETQDKVFNAKGAFEISEFSFGGHDVPAGTHVIYSAWISHLLGQVPYTPLDDREVKLPHRKAGSRRAPGPPVNYVPARF